MPVRIFHFIMGLALLFIVTGCSLFQPFKLMAPEHAGFEKVRPNLYLETGSDATAQKAIVAAVDQAEDSVRTAYGSVASQPIVYACVTDGCYERFGGRGSIAKIYFGRRILLSPRGLNRHFVAHEWSHGEMFSRLTFGAWYSLPQWFDEGVAVSVSEAPEHSEEHWQFLVEKGVPRPSSDELYAMTSLLKWDDALERFGEKKNPERKAQGQPEIRPVYTAAGHEVRPWLKKVGSEGLLRLIDQLNRGVDFDASYRAQEGLVR